MRSIRPVLWGSAFWLALAPAVAPAAVTAPAGYIYNTEVLGSLTESCVAAGPGGTFVGIGPAFTANAQAVVLVNESGAARLVALGFNSISDCAYDAAHDVLYITDNAADGDLPGAITGDTVFAVKSASTASAFPAAGLELVAPKSVPHAASVAVDASGKVLVSDATGSGAGTVSKIDPASPALTPFASGFDFTGGIAINPASGDVFVAETTDAFETIIRHFSSGGTEQPVFAGPGSGFGSYDLAFSIDGQLLATGLFPPGDVVAFDAAGTPSAFVSGLNFANSITVNRFTGRVEILSGFTGTDEDRSLERFTPVSRLVPGRGTAATECLHEFYGLALAPGKPGAAAKKAICVDGAPCDADGQVNGSCLFPVGFCFNVPDPNFPECAAAIISDVEISSKPPSAAIGAAAARVASALPLTGPSCIFSDGVAVPLKTTSAGQKNGQASVRVTATTMGSDADKDSVLLVCEPAP